jgi:hypothetical protein
MRTAVALLSAVVLAQAPSGDGRIPPYPGATDFCTQFIVGAPTGDTPGPSIDWTAYYTADAPETVVAWYHGRLASGLHRREGREDIWRVPFDEPSAVLTVSTVADFTLAASCRARPPATARAVIVSSTMTRPRADAAARAQPSAKAVRRSFPAAGITKVVLRAAAADTALVTRVAGLTTIDMAGTPTGGAPGYHPSDPKWRETPAAEWGLDFVSERHGGVLIVSTRNEVRYLHHHYAFEALTVRVPIGVGVVTERRELTDKGAPDLH